MLLSTTNRDQRNVELFSQFSPKRPIKNRLLELTKLGFTSFLDAGDGAHVLMNLIEVAHDAALLVDRWKRNDKSR